MNFSAEGTDVRIAQVVGENRQKVGALRMGLGEEAAHTALPVLFVNVPMLNS